MPGDEFGVGPLPSLIAKREAMGGFSRHLAQVKGEGYRNKGIMHEWVAEARWKNHRVMSTNTHIDFETTRPPGRVVSIWRKEQVLALGGEPKGSCE